MEKYKYLVKNIGLLTLSNFATKLLSFFLVPLYTRVLTTTEYGTFDLLNATIGVMVPILTLDILDAVIRFSMEKDANLDAIASVGFEFLAASTLIVIGGLALNHVLCLSSILDQYAVCFLLMFFAQASSGIITSYARGTDHIASLSISSLITSSVIIFGNIIFLVVFKWGLAGYFIANIMGPIVQSIYLLRKTGIIQHIHITTNYQEEKGKMIEYSKPLIANAIAWWVNNVSDRYVVTFFLGLSVNGIYSVASKIPALLNILQTIFSQAWSLSAVKEYDPEDKNGFFRNTYGVYNAVMVVSCSGIILFNRLMARFLYAEEFYSAWQYVPWLTIAIVFGSLSGYLGGFFSAVKNSKIFAQSTMIGAGINIVLNLILTPWIGALGAAIATSVCYFVVWVIRLYHSRKYVRLKINLARDISTYLLLIIQAMVFLLITKEGVLLYTIQTVLFGIIAVLYGKEIKKIAKKMYKIH